MYAVKLEVFLGTPFIGDRWRIAYGVLNSEARLTC